jgi:hypothetical protein
MNKTTQCSLLFGSLLGLTLSLPAFAEGGCQKAMSPPHPAWAAVGTTALATADGVTEIKVVAVAQ